MITKCYMKWSEPFFFEKSKPRINQGILIGDIVYLITPEDSATKFTLTPCGWKIPQEMYTPQGLSFSFIGHPITQEIKQKNGKAYMATNEAYIEPILTFERIK